MIFGPSFGMWLWGMGVWWLPGLSALPLSYTRTGGGIRTRDLSIESG